MAAEHESPKGDEELSQSSSTKEELKKQLKPHRGHAAKIAARVATRLSSSAVAPVRSWIELLWARRASVGAFAVAASALIYLGTYAYAFNFALTFGLTPEDLGFSRTAVLIRTTASILFFLSAFVALLIVPFSAIIFLSWGIMFLESYRKGRRPRPLQAKAARGQTESRSTKDLGGWKREVLLLLLSFLLGVIGKLAATITQEATWPSSSNGWLIWTCLTLSIYILLRSQSILVLAVITLLIGVASISRLFVDGASAGARVADQNCNSHEESHPFIYGLVMDHNVTLVPDPRAVEGKKGVGKKKEADEKKRLTYLGGTDNLSVFTDSQYIYRVGNTGELVIRTPVPNSLFKTLEKRKKNKTSCG